MTLAQQLHIAFLLLQNAALLALGAMGYCQARQWLVDRLPQRAERLLFGLAFGGLGVGSMLAFVPVEGLQVDLAVPVLVVATLFGGIEAGAMTSAIVTLARAALTELPLGLTLVNIPIAFGLSAVDVMVRRRRGSEADWRDLVGLGLAVSLTGLGAAALSARPYLSPAALRDGAVWWVVLVTLTVISLGSVVRYFERGRQLRQALQERESDLKAIMDNAPVAIFLKDRDYRYRLVNRAFNDWSDREIEFHGRTDFEIYPEDFARLSHEGDKDVLELGRVSQTERRTWHSRPGIEYVLVTKFPVRDADGRIVGTAGFLLDISERKRAEEALLRSQRLLSESQRLGKLGYLLTDSASDRVYWSESMFEMRKVPRREFFTFEESIAFLHPEDREEFLKLRAKALAEGRDFPVEGRVVRGDGSLAWERGIGHPRFDKDGELTGVLIVVQDVTESRQAEIALRESREQLLESQRVGKVGYILSDIIQERVYWSDTIFELRGVPRREFFTFDETMEYIHPDDRENYLRVRAAAIAERRDYTIDVRVVRADGSHGWEHSVAHPRFDRSGKLTGMLVVVRDITESRRAEEALRQSEARFRALIEQSSDIVAVVAPGGVVTYRSPPGADALGYTPADVVGRQLLAYVHPDDREALAATLQSIGAIPGRSAAGRSRLRHKDGTWRHIAWSARSATDVPGIAGIIFNARDVTEARNLEEQLLQAQKMEAIGQLAGGIAHDFNNILGAIMGFGSFLAQDLPAGTPQHSFAERIVMAGDRGKELVQQVLAFSRRSGVERSPVELRRIVLETCDLLRASLPSSTRLEVGPQLEDLVAEVNAGQISQILLNLCLNANDALMGAPGQISVATTRVSPGASDYELFHAGDAPASVAATNADGRVIAGVLDVQRAYARLTISDTGAGMATDVLEHIFEPFFTTKKRGRGTGLGLSVVHGIVMAYEGACVVTSRPGGGTVFAIYLPLSEATPAAVEAVEPELAGRERILVVDDEVDMTDVLTIGLDRLGYEVVALNDPEEALATFAEDPSAWDVVISDQVMPGLKGLSLFERLKAIRPSIFFILCTGFSDGATENMALAAGVDAFFIKPVPAERLAAAIRRAMEKPAAAVRRP